MDATALRLDIADLRRHPGTRRRVSITAAAFPGARVGASELDPSAPPRLDAALEALAGGVVVQGRITFGYRATCRRCLRPVARTVETPVRELFEASPVEGETYPLAGDLLDLEPAVRDAVVLELPPAPLCDPACAGLCPSCGADRNETACGCPPVAPDPRWDALRELTF